MSIQEKKHGKVSDREPKKPKKKLLTAYTVHDIHKILRSCFNQAIKWDIMVKIPLQALWFQKPDIL